MPARHRNRLVLPAPLGPTSPTLSPRLTVKQFLYRTRQFFSTYVLHPFTLGSLLLFAIFWVVLRIGRRSA